jgi:hypothetical protein
MGVKFDAPYQGNAEDVAIASLTDPWGNVDRI